MDSRRNPPRMLRTQAKSQPEHAVGLMVFTHHRTS
jgi:hypothetical protein